MKRGHTYDVEAYSLDHKYGTEGSLQAVQEHAQQVCSTFPDPFLHR